MHSISHKNVRLSLLASAMVLAFSSGSALAYTYGDVTVSNYTEDGTAVTPSFTDVANITIGSSSVNELVFATEGNNYAANTSAASTGKILAKNIKADASAHSIIAYLGGKLEMGGSGTELIDITATERGITSWDAGSDIKITTKALKVTAGQQALLVETGASVTINADDVTLASSGNSDKAALNVGNSDNGTSGGHVSITASTVSLTGAGEYGAIHMQSNTQSETLTGNESSLVINADTINISSTHRSGAAIDAFSNSQLTLNGNVTVEAASGIAIGTRGHSTININSDGSHTTVINGDVEFSTPNTTSSSAGSGNIIDSQVNLNLAGEGSSWTGRAYQEMGARAEKTTALSGNNSYYGDVKGFNLAISDGAVWNATGESFVNDIRLDNGTVNLSESDGANVNVGTLAGAGEVKVDAENPATLTLTENTEADVTLTTKQNSDDVTPEQAAALKASVFTGEGTASNVTTQIDEGMYNQAITVDPSGSVTLTANSVMESTNALAAATTLSVNRLLMNDVRKRLGDIRSAQGTSGVWARYDGGRLSGHGVDNDFNTVQFGFDTVPDGTNVRFGVAGSYTNGDADFKRGSADMDAFSVAGYATWMADNGAFADAVLRIASVKNDIKVDGTKKGRMDNIALSASGEVGWRFKVNESFYVEPQAELTYTYVNSENLKLRDGTSTWSYDYASVNSVLGRAGVAAGYTFPENKGSLYVKASAVHEFAGDSKVYGENGASQKTDGKDTWVEYGLGAQYNVSKSTYLWADVERTDGGDLDEEWRATVGVRYSF